MPFSDILLRLQLNLGIENFHIRCQKVVEDERGYIFVRNLLVWI